MKKLLMILVLGLSLIGCTSMETGQALTKGNKTYIKVTDNNVFYLKDNISLEEYYSISALSIETNFFLETSKHVRIDLRYYPKTKSLYLLFPDYEDGYFNLIKGIMFSNGQVVTNAEISNLSNIISSDIPNTRLKNNQAKTLYNIMNSNKSITLRVLSSEGYFDIQFRNEDKKGFAELLEIYLGLKSYDIKSKIKG